MRWSIRVATVAFTLTAAAFGVPAEAQEIDFTGSWVPIYHEDGPERIPGPELFDYCPPSGDPSTLRT